MLSSPARIAASISRPVAWRVALAHASAGVHGGWMHRGVTVAEAELELVADGAVDGLGVGTAPADRAGPQARILVVEAGL
jgi:hypothetical protein